jgi:hypothetical protein
MALSIAAQSFSFGVRRFPARHLWTAKRWRSSCSSTLRTMPARWSDRARRLIASGSLLFERELDNCQLLARTYVEASLRVPSEPARSQIHDSDKW